MTPKEKTSKTMYMVLWITQGILAVTFIFAGIIKIGAPEDLPFPWVKEHTTLVLITGFVDLLGGIGIVLPTLLGIQPRLTLYTAYGIIALMLAAIVFHISRGEAKDIGFTIFIALLAVFVVWGRQTHTS